MKLPDIVQNEITELDTVLRDSSYFVKAKAMRLVLLSNKHLETDVLFKNTHPKPNPRNTTKSKTDTQHHSEEPYQTRREDRRECRQRKNSDLQQQTIDIATECTRRL